MVAVRDGVVCGLIGFIVCQMVSGNCIEQLQIMLNLFWCSYFMGGWQEERMRHPRGSCRKVGILPFMKQFECHDVHGLLVILLVC